MDLPYQQLQLSNNLCRFVLGSGDILKGFCPILHCWKYSILSSLKVVLLEFFFFSIHHKFSIWFKSGDWLGNFNTSISLCTKHFWVALAMYVIQIIVLLKLLFINESHFLNRLLQIIFQNLSVFDSIHSSIKYF